MINIFRILRSCLSGGDEQDDDDDLDNCNNRLATEHVTELATEHVTDLATKQVTELATESFKLFDASDSIKSLQFNTRTSPLFYSQELFNDNYIHSYYKNLYPKSYKLLKLKIITPSFRSQDPNDSRASLP